MISLDFIDIRSWYYFRYVPIMGAESFGFYCNYLYFTGVDLKYVGGIKH